MWKSAAMTVLSYEDIAKLISIGEVIELMRELFAEVGRNQVVLPERTVIDLPNDGTVLFMPAYVPNVGGIGVKIVSVFPHNLEKGIPTVNAQVLLTDPETGRIMAIMDGTMITALRTAAVSALATDLLAVKGAERLGVLGAGVQARAHINALLRIRKIRQILIYSLEFEKSESLAREFDRSTSSSFVCRGVRSAEEVVIHSDIIVTATTSHAPVLHGNLLRDGTHINAIGSFKPHTREVDDETIQRSRIFVDLRAAALKEAGDLLIPMSNGVISESDIVADLGELVLAVRPGRQNDKEITFFKSVGLAVEDIIVAKRIFDRAEVHSFG